MRVRSNKKAYREYCQDIIQKYRDDGGTWPAPMKVVARWAINNRLWERLPASDIQLCARELSRAAREEYYTDPQGRRVRKKHAFRANTDEEDGQTTFWTDIETALPGDMQLALQQRRMAITGDCKQLKTDADSYNQNNPHGAEVQLSFNFEEDLAELEQPTEYNPGPQPE